MNTQYALFRSRIRAAIAFAVMAAASHAHAAPDYQILHAFESQPAHPGSGLTLGTDGAVYGITRAGGLDQLGVIYKMQPGGSDFTVLHEFAIAEGCVPSGGLIDVSGVLYGVLPFCGPHDGGAVFRINEDGTGFAVIHAFDPTTEG